ncbi:MAG: glutamine synthetase family protein [Bacteroidota bacterium]|nr:glutamine synthetase family protein [Bacteroidota bacterium]
MNAKIELNQNPIVAYLKKSPKEFTMSDIIKYITDNGIQMVNFRYAAGDGRLKTLNFVITNLEYLEQILSLGERVDGSSLFHHMQASSSDLYVVPRFSTAFIDPFEQIPTICFLCYYFDKDGNMLDSSPEYTLKKAEEKFEEVSGGMHFEAMGELEYYVVGQEEERFDCEQQRGYQESTPFSKYESFRTCAMYYMAQCGCIIKYAHSEVGNFVMDGKNYEQNEIEFLPVDVQDAADQLMIGKWILRTLAKEYELDLTFAPKIITGEAGSGMHIHTRVVKDGKNMYVNNGELSEVAKKVIAGIVTLAPSLTAFGNANPTSYFRLVPHQEAPTTICWGDRNRSAMVRVPLGWTTKNNMCQMANPQNTTPMPNLMNKQTVEFRCPDGSANVYLLLAGLVVAARKGFEMQDWQQVAEQTYITTNIHDSENEKKREALRELPTCCVESASLLEEQRKEYEQYNVFSPSLIDGIISKLNSYNDKTLREDCKKDAELLKATVRKYFYCG